MTDNNNKYTTNTPKTYEVRYVENKQKFLLANQKYRAKLKSKKPPKNPSLFQQKKQQRLLKLLVNQKSFVPPNYSVAVILLPLKSIFAYQFLLKTCKAKKTGTLYFQGEKIGDAKLSGEVMLPGQTYYDKEANVAEFLAFLKQISGIEYKSISQHFIWQKIITENDYTPLIKQNSFISAREPPGKWRNNLSKIVNY
ncbi:6692_t:CDS:2 [Funneliformis geosporum]|uniref:6692_t:CDS:1 n=1 Tax=Funneliformis geosporum TaxID=1117311 RepID=A0A9W4STP8_9GLOM|nr:6692_t:CDS:2 [Funneliformis geosporum]